jgi:hypothetical protein
MVIDHFEVEPVPRSELKYDEGHPYRKEHCPAPFEAEPPVAQQQVSRGSHRPRNGGLLGIESKGEEDRTKDEDDI